MLQTIESVKAYLRDVLTRAGMPATVCLLRSTRDELPRVVLTPLDSPVDRDSKNAIENDVLEIHCVAGTPERAVEMLDAVVDALSELQPGGMPIRGATLTGCEMVGQRSVTDQTDVEDTYDGTSTWRFTTEKPRPRPA